VIYNYCFVGKYIKIKYQLKLLCLLLLLTPFKTPNNIIKGSYNIIKGSYYIVRGFKRKLLLKNGSLTSSKYF